MVLVEKEGYVLALNEDLREVTGMEDFKNIWEILLSIEQWIIIEEILKE